METVVERQTTFELSKKMILEAKLGKLTDEQGWETHKLGKTRSEAWRHPQPRRG